MRPVVLDCSVTMAWCFEDQADPMTDRVLDSLDEREGLVPCIWPLEVANVLLVAERHARLAEADSARFLDLLGALPILVEEVSLAGATGAVLSAARQVELSSYDAAYLELAMRSGALLATRDQSLGRAARQAGVELFA